MMILPACDKELFERGAVVGTYGSPDAMWFESLIKDISRITGCQVDWHFCAGHAVVKCWLRDLVTVRAAMDSVGKRRLRAAAWARVITLGIASARIAYG